MEAAAPNPAAPAPAPAKAKPVVWTNLITLLGLLHVAGGLLLMVTFWLFTVVSPTGAENPYLGVVGYMILPGILVNGLILCPLGIVIRRWRLKRRGADAPPLRHISIRTALIFLGITFFLILPLLGVAGYEGYHFTESAEFCGTVCHNMDPHYKRYLRSPHARVTCAGCHIGPGASPFVKSKLSGLRQVYKTIGDSYPRPIPPAITELRPARDTCEQCHWPSQFFGSQLKKIPHYAPDKGNTLNTYEILVKVGGLNHQLNQAEGIHMHMLDRVEYVAEDHHTQVIPWVRYHRPDGGVSVYRSDGKASADPPPAGQVRRLDCIDCHNLAGHEFMSPERAVDQALSVKLLDVTLPFIKREAVRALSQGYETTPQAVEGIGKALDTFYSTKFPEVYASQRPAIDKSIAAAQDIFRAQMFPEMKVNWRTYPSNVGHTESAGCFRCHDGLHVADDGRKITNDCTACHSFLYRDPKTPGTINEKAFDHPNKIHLSWKGLGPHEKMACTDCHDGGLGALGWRESNSMYTCGDCHPSGRWMQIRERIRGRESAATRPTTAPVTQ